MPQIFKLAGQLTKKLQNIVKVFKLFILDLFEDGVDVMSYKGFDNAGILLMGSILRIR